MNKTEQNTVQQRTLKENCGKLFIKLLQLAAMKSKIVEENARIHIQDLINSKTTVEDFASRIGALLNTNFNKSIFDSLKSGLPLLRLALFRRELIIEGLSPPPCLTWGLTVQKAPAQLTRQPQTSTAKVIYIPSKMKVDHVDEEIPTLAPLSLATFPKPAIENSKKIKFEPMEICYEHSLTSLKQASTATKSENANEDSNDVLAMCGINLDQELHFNAVGNHETILSRSCPPETSFLHLPILKARFRAILQKRGLDDISVGVFELLSTACREHLKDIVEKLVVIAEHRTDSLKSDARYEICKNVRGQLKFLEDVDKAELKRHKEMEREILMRASKLKTKSDNPELARMRAKAKEMQRTEMEEMRQRDADMTALYAIGPRKKAKLESETCAFGSEDGTSMASAGTITPKSTNNRPKRVNLQDLLFFMEQDPQLCRSQMLHEAYLK